ncbi:selenide, water dikinase SelD [Segetibacter sp.]|jgi:selenide,water dikinase|uniref:selenide, water dikinase SelD n=1 Tax=Segetibacter sp. TaxID=2231182 RepID=UPI00262F9F86|nr:selenide, water dikinase SelD [Segetibacter sp.]MCW3080964.1 selenide, water dikinase SelD [Segetibacter sp.]
MSENIKLTQYSHGGGCGCKIAPSVLAEILNSQFAFPDNKNLLVGNHSKDDAAVYDLGNGTAVISTTDFFMPIVNDPFDFGRIASANAISDVYAMGGKPIMAIAILGWPIDKLPASVAQKVLEGSRSICAEAGIPLAGGHSIDAPEPIFGLAVTGMVNIENLKQNNTAKEGDLLFITKRLGVGIVSTAQKRELITEEHFASLLKQLTQLNSLGEKFGKIKGVNAMTDITGFGLLGHLTEMAEGSGLTAEIVYDKLPIIDGAKDYLAKKVVPGATNRNWNSISDGVIFDGSIDQQEAINLLADPQTNGGLLISVSADSVKEVETLLTENGYAAFSKPIGKMIKSSEKVIMVM